jgi:hypothetical protein
MATTFWTRLGLAILLVGLLGISTYAFAHDSWWSSRQTRPHIPAWSQEQTWNMNGTYGHLTSQQQSYWCNNHDNSLTHRFWPTQRNAHRMGHTRHSRYGAWSGASIGGHGHHW